MVREDLYKLRMLQIVKIDDMYFQIVEIDFEDLTVKLKGIDSEKA